MGRYFTFVDTEVQLVLILKLTLCKMDIYVQVCAYIKSLQSGDLLTSLYGNIVKIQMLSSI